MAGERQLNREKPIRISQEEFLTEFQLQLTEASDKHVQGTLTVRTADSTIDTLKDLVAKVNQLEQDGKRVRFFRDGRTRKLSIEPERGYFPGR